MYIMLYIVVNTISGSECKVCAVAPHLPYARVQLEEEKYEVNVS